MSKSILIADDEPVMREFLSEVLEDYEIETAIDGADAIEKIKVKEFDLIITDMKMPKVSGEEVVKFTKENYDTTKIIVISGYSSLTSVSNTVSYGANAFLAKPFTIKQLRSEVEKALNTGDFSQTGGIKAS